MNWINLIEESQLEKLKELSEIKTQVIFKHSTRCHISSMVKNGLEKSLPPGTIDFYYLDLIKYRTLSAKIADDFAVNHESPQVLLIKNGNCVYDESHNDINMDEITKLAS
jgi:bacillithiol system protein YtxJ